MMFPMTGADACPRIPYEDAVCYGMHVRGFTMHSSSGVKARGTFAGIGEKLDYLEQLGITTIELQPIYEQIELRQRESGGQPQERYGEYGLRGQPGLSGLSLQPGEYEASLQPRLNYWGYQEGYYYAPKRSYAAAEDAATELKDLVKALHTRGMEMILQFYFPDNIPTDEVLNILRYWSWAYHVDGFT